MAASWRASLSTFLMLLSSAAFAAPEKDSIVGEDLFVPHRSTLAAIPGQLVGLHVRHKGPQHSTGRVVLFVHGATVPGVPAFDLAYQDYDWMARLARAGFDAYAMDLSGYGSSPRPMMDDPCNVEAKQQGVLIPRPLKEPCAPHYAFAAGSVVDDWTEIDSVVDYLRKKHHVAKISMVGWSAGGPRVGGYVAGHQGKIARVMFYAPGAPRAGLKNPQGPQPGVPIALQTREDLEKKRWDPDVRCPGQLAPGVRDALWRDIMEWDKVGASWGPPEGVMRGPARAPSGWTPEQAAKIRVPVLVMFGEFDVPEQRRATYDTVGSHDKLLVEVACASHFMVWEKQHSALQAASLEFLAHGTVAGEHRGELSVDPAGHFRQGLGGLTTPKTAAR